MKSNTFKIILPIFFAVIAIFSFYPNKAEAGIFSRIIDPFCIASDCDDDNNNDNNNNNVDTDPTLVVSCAPYSTDILRGESVTWRANVTGGNGSYNYVWEGTDGLYGSNNLVYKIYNSLGTKTGRVTVSSGLQTVVRSCGSVSVTEEENGGGDDNDPILNVSCSVSDDNVYVDDSVTYTANATGGTGSYRYDWSGSESLSGSSRTVYKDYSRTGTKNASVTVTSGSQTKTRTCDDVVVRNDNNDDDYYDDDYYYDNNDDSSNLRVSCSVDRTSANINDLVRWRTSVSGGNGRYDYQWYGTDNINSYSPIVDIRYQNAGSKNARVTVTSAYQSITRDCGLVNIRDRDTNYNNYSYNYTNYTNTNDSSYLTVSCYPSVNQSRTGQTVSWGAAAGGGNGDYNFTWNGTDGLNGVGLNVFKAYSSAGTKTANVTVTSGGRSVSATCASGIYVSNPTTTYTPPVTAKPPVKDTTNTDDNNVNTRGYVTGSALSAAAAYAIDSISGGAIAWLLIFILICIIAYLVIQKNKK